MRGAPVKRVPVKVPGETGLGTVFGLKVAERPAPGLLGNECAGFD